MRGYYGSTGSAAFVALLLILVGGFFDEIRDLILFVLPGSTERSVADAHRAMPLEPVPEDADADLTWPDATRPPLGGTTKSSRKPRADVAAPGRDPQAGGPNSRNHVPPTAKSAPTASTPSVSPYRTVTTGAPTREPPDATATDLSQEPASPPGAGPLPAGPRERPEVSASGSDSTSATADGHQVSDILRRAAAEQAAGRLIEARRLLEWVVAMHKDTPDADEASRRLKELVRAQQAQREQAAADVLREALALQEQGKLAEAQRLFDDILNRYDDTAASEAARRRHLAPPPDDAAEALRAAIALQDAGDPAEAYRQLRDLIRRHPGTVSAREAQRLVWQMETPDAQRIAETLRRAADAQAAGRLSEARRLLEWVVTMYQGTAAVEEAYKRLQALTKAERARREKTAAEAPRPQDLPEEDAAEALRAAVAVQAGDPAEAYRQLSAVVGRYPGTASARGAQRLLRLIESAGETEIRALLQRAQDHQAAGRLSETRRLLEWVVTMYQDSASADEAYRRLQALAQVERAQREATAARVLQQAMALEEKGDLAGAQRLFSDVLALYRGTPAGEESLRRQRRVEDILAQREAAEQLQRALDLQQQGRLDDARWLLEDIARKYRNTPAAKEATRRLLLLRGEQP